MMSEMKAAKDNKNSNIKWIALAVLTAINLINYIDRYIFSALSPAIQKDLHLNDTELGWLGSGFIFSYLLIALLFGWLGDKGPRSKLMGLGATVWSLATGFSGLARSFQTQMLTRVVVGLGESAYTVIAPSALADLFTKDQRGRVFAIYSGAIPVGSALGYVLGGYLEAQLGWHRAFMVVGVPGLFLSLLIFFLPDPKRGQSDDLAHLSSKVESIKDGHSPDSVPPKTFFQNSLELAGNGGLVMTILGYAAYTFVVGGMGFWMPSYITRYFGVTLAKGDMVFGAVTVVGGFVGTLLGGFWSDRIERRAGNGFLKVCFWAMVVAAPLFYVALLQKDFTAFCICLFFLDVAIFMCSSPLDAAVLGFAAPGLRSLAMAWNVCLIHLLGDGISRILVGYVSDSANLQTAIYYFPPVLILAGLLWLVGLQRFWQPLNWPSEALVLPKLQIHRGLWRTGEHRENTLSAFRKAAQLGAEMIELDVRLSRNGEVVVHHDADLTRLELVSKQVAECDTSELRGYGVDTLADVLADAQLAQTKVNIEIKSESALDGRLERAVAEVVKQAQASSRVLFSSFNPLALRRLSYLLPQVPRALLVTQEDDPKNKSYLKRMTFALLSRAHILHLDEKMLTTSEIQKWRGRGVPLVAWTVNTAARKAELYSLGIVSVISDQLGN